LFPIFLECVVIVADFIQDGLFLRTKPVNALIALSREEQAWYASSLAKEIDCTFPHIIKLLSKFKELGLVSFKADGRKKLIFLTSKGRKISADFCKLSVSLS